MWLLIDDERNLNTEAVARTAEASEIAKACVSVLARRMPA